MSIRKKKFDINNYKGECRNFLEFCLSKNTSFQVLEITKENKKEYKVSVDVENDIDGVKKISTITANFDDEGNCIGQTETTPARIQ